MVAKEEQLKEKVRNNQEKRLELQNKCDKLKQKLRKVQMFYKKNEQDFGTDKELFDDGNDDSEEIEEVKSENAS